MKTIPGILVALALQGCSSNAQVKPVSVDEFRLLNQPPQVGSMYFRESLGIAEQQGCIAIHEMASTTQKWRKQIYCVAATSLTPDEQARLEQEKIHGTDQK